MKDRVFIPERLSHKQFWRSLLRHWCILLGRYEPEASGEEDFDFWIAADPLTDLLASAACLLPDGWSREFRNNSQRPSSNLLGLGQGNVETTVAARIYWVAEPFAAACAAVKKKLDEAKGSLQDAPPEQRRSIPISICYVVPEFDGSEAMMHGLKSLSSLASWAKTETMITATHITASNETEYPGVLLVAREETWDEIPSAQRRED